ncbi:MAG: ribosome small subunit-dependent GTPase A [Sphingobacteriales bacterium]|nr:MAG: ribosome small subunit-dependent GTPase A [Sphingobacteriales bacterium]
MQGRVIQSTGAWYQVKGEDGLCYACQLRGKFRLNASPLTNPVAVGDEVEIEEQNDIEKTAMITGIVPRRNYINRQSPSHKMHHHIVASNLDQSVLFATLKEPKTSSGFIDRFLVTSEAYHIPAIVVFNKTDVYKEKELQRLQEWTAMYEAIGYKVIATSLKENKGVDIVRDVLKDKTTLISGHSGVGKSTFINTLFPQMNLRTQDVSEWSGKGLHTTTFAEMFDLPFGGKLIDTPGIRELGLVDISKQELSHYFPEMRALMQECQFNNCMHFNEPGCAIKEAVAAGIIAEARYVSYYNISETINEKKY